MNWNYSTTSKFLCFCSGVNLKVLHDDCSSEINKYAAVGATILFTALFATISATYAINRVFIQEDNGIWYALLIGLIWGVMIFNLDRYIVMSLKKEGKPFHELMHAIPRFAMGILISLVISKPLEVKLFENRIQRQIFETEFEKEKSDVSESNRLYGVDSLSEKVNIANTEVSRLRKSLDQEPTWPIFRSKKREKENAKNQWDETKRRNLVKINNNVTNRRKIWKGRTYSELTQNEKIRVDNYYRNNKMLNAEIKSAEDNYNSLGEELLKINEKFQKSMQAQLDHREKEKMTIEADANIAKEKSTKKIKKASETNETAFSENFMTQVEALGRLTESDETLKKTGWLLTLLFLMIELAPILVKLISKKGLYDETMLADDQLELAKQIEKRNQEFDRFINRGNTQGQDPSRT